MTFLDVKKKFVKTNKSHDSKNIQKHSSNVVYTLQSKLANVSKDFKNVLEVRNEVRLKTNYLLLTDFLLLI